MSLSQMRKTQAGHGEKARAKISWQGSLAESALPGGFEHNLFEFISADSAG